MDPSSIVEKLGTCANAETGDINKGCVQGVLATLDPAIIGKLAQCAGADSIADMQACVEEQLTPPDIVCAEDIKLCPDGSLVARDPANNCSFRICPLVLIPSCTVNGRKYSVGETYTAPDGCNTCACVRGGEITCTVMACPRDDPEPEKKVDEKPSEIEMYVAYYNTNNRDGPMNCCKQKSQACCRCCKDECAMKEKGDIDDIPSCKRECRDYYGRDTCSNGDEGPFDCCTSESRSCCRCCMNECGERYKGDLALIEDCKKYVCRDGYYGVRDPGVCKE
jgi:hypothetical protein